MQALLAHMGVSEVHVLAHDYGDTVGQELLARHNERAKAGDSTLSLKSICFLNGGTSPARRSSVARTPPQ
jgi:pimeloyl-ACP methyl ester carboxylesterase